MVDKFYYKSPVGVLEIEFQDKALVGLKFVESVTGSNGTKDYGIEVIKQLDEYFAGARTKFDLNIMLVGTEFQKKVWTELLKIPYGKTKSYQEIAEALGNPNAQRAVGSACNKNPMLIVIPCHRVISKSGNLTGFAGGLKAKEGLLKLENTI